MYVYRKQSSWNPNSNTTQCNLIGRSMTAPPPVISPSSILPPPSSPRAFIPAAKNLVCVSKTLLFQFFTILETACPKLRNLKLHSRAMSVFAKCLVRILGTAQTVLTGVSWLFSVPSPNVGAVRQIRPQLLPFTSFDMRHSLLIHHSTFLSQRRWMKYKQEWNIDQEYKVT